MKEIKPKGWLINDGTGEFFTSKEGDLTVADRFNWKVAPLYSDQSLAEGKAEAVMGIIDTAWNGKSQLDVDDITNYANKLKGGE